MNCMKSSDKQRGKPRLARLTFAMLMALYPLRILAAGGLTDLGGLNGSGLSFATGVSADGSVVVGQARDGAASNTYRAFRWTQAGVMESLGTLNGGTSSNANGVSADGSVVVGYAADGAASNAVRAFRWTRAGRMESLGTLNGGAYSYADGVSADGSVVVGYATDGAASNTYRAFRWTRAGRMESLGTLNGGAYSYAHGVSADGSVVVGSADDGAASNAARAFRWTQVGRMESLGTLNGGASSSASGVSADGSVVVGVAYDGAASNAARAFRWTRVAGMQSVEQWLAGNGVAVEAGMSTAAARATNADGTVVVGRLTNGHAFVARVVPATPGASVGSGMIDVQDFTHGLYRSGYAHVQAIAQSDLVMHGLHGTPMSMRLPAGQHGVWVSGDWGRQESKSIDGSVGSGEIGLAYGVTDGLMIKLALGRTYSWLDTSHNGESTMRGTYLMPEVIAAISGTPMRISVSGYYNTGDADIKRGYLNAGAAAISSGSADVRSEALRLRLDWFNAFALGSLGLTPYASLTYFHSHVDGYTESGGGFPVHWDSRSERAKQARLGLDGAYILNDRITLLGRLEAVRQMDGNSAGASGVILGLSNFELEGLGYKRNWLRAGAGAEVKAGSGTVSLMLNGTTETDGPTFWGNASYKLVF